MNIIILTDYYTDKYIGAVKKEAELEEFAERWLQENEQEALEIEYHEGGRIGVWKESEEVQISGDNGLIIWKYQNVII